MSKYNSLEDAYSALKIDNGASLSDEDVGVAFYRNTVFGSGQAALETIAEARRSRFLRFLAAIEVHLNASNIAVLANKTFADLPKPKDVSKQVADAELVGEGTAGGESSQTLASESSDCGMEMDAYGEYYATGEDSTSELRSPSSSEASGISSSDETTSADSDFSEEVGETVFDLQTCTWRCEECFTMLVDGKCPNGHELRRCETCGWQLDNGPCQRCLVPCGSCGKGSADGQCGKCGATDESEDEDFVAFDEYDDVWRCIYCSWEVEADSETDGNCHCLNDKGEAHFIDLSECFDYEPADSYSSEEDDSSDSEPDSDDERFIDDSEFPEEGMAAIEAVNLADLAKLYSGSVFEKFAKNYERFRAENMAEDKENVEPTASSDDIEVIDPQTANVPPVSPSNIIDCETMDL